MGALLPACFPEKNYVRAVMIVMRFVSSDLDQSSIFKQRRPAARLATHSLQSSKLDQLQQEHLQQTSTASERDPKLAAATTSTMYGPNTHHFPVVSPTNTACTQGPLQLSAQQQAAAEQVAELQEQLLRQQLVAAEQVAGLQDQLQQLQRAGQHLLPPHQQ
jgi:hypothetical protein